MKRLAIATIAFLGPLLSFPAMAGHNTVRMGEFEVEPKHCVYDPMFGAWNCWYGKPNQHRKRRYNHHYDDHHHHGGGFTPNKWNQHGVPCYIYKSGPWCF
jgi:hypothetical protein